MCMGVGRRWWGGCWDVIDGCSGCNAGIGVWRRGWIGGREMRGGRWWRGCGGWVLSWGERVGSESEIETGG